MLSYTRFELLRTLRNPRFLVMTMLFPVLINVAFVQLNSARYSASDLQVFATAYMMDMAAFATVSACLSTAGNRLAQERSSGWFSYLTLTPLRPIDIVGGKILASIGVGVPAVIAVFASGVLVNGVRVNPLLLLAALGIVIVGSVAFAALGTVIGLVTTGETAYAASMIALMFFAIFGGLWMPRDSLPAWLGALVELTPSYQIAHFGTGLVTGTPVSIVEALLVFCVWAVAFIVPALLAYRRSAVATR
jgi:ABC-2 type transport system permease protein